ncbi:MAG: cytochrome C biogenesis protein [Anaerolineae bacterium]|nr:cytochrome C biogenesis protein [Anaerolineae bacterium]
MSYLRKVLAIVWKDIVAELRTKEMFSAMFVFAVLVIVIFTFAFDLRVSGDRVRQVAPGALWVAFAFAGILGLNRAFVAEKDRGCLEGLLLAPVDHTAIYFGKMISTVLFMLVVEALMLPVFTAFFGVNLFDLRLVLIIVLGTVGFASVGTILSAMTAQTRAREVLLPILLLPVAAPVLIAAVKATAGILDGLTMADVSLWWQLLLAFAFLYPAIAFMTFDFIVKE